MNYYETLNISSTATKSEIKHAYRQLAKKYHPDISKDPDAHNKFIEISEAYESLMGYSNVYDQTTTYAWDDFYNEEDLRRQRAREYAQMKYEEFVRNNEAFKKSWYYRPAVMLNNFLSGVLYILALFCFATAVYLFINFNIMNLIGGFMFVAGGMFVVKIIRATSYKN